MSETTTETPSTTISTTATATASTVGYVSGFVCSDAGRDGLCDTGDAPVANAAVVLRWPNGTVFATATTNSSGMFEIPSTPYPGETLIVEGPPGSPSTNLTLDTSGSGTVDVPIAQPQITGSIFYDMDSSSNLTSGDTPLNDTNVLLLLPNGTVYANLATASDGTFLYDPSNPVYDTNLTVVLAAAPSVVLGTFTTDAAGNGNIDIPLPPPTSATGLIGDIWIDADGDGVQDADEVPYKAKGVYIILPDNSILPGTIDSLGHFSFNTSNVSLSNTPLTIYDAATGQQLANFTTDLSGNAYVPIPIPIPTDPVGVTIANSSTNCLPVDTAYTAAVGAPLQTGNTTRQIQVDLASSTNYTAGSAKAPYGWTLQYSTDGGKSWTATEPSPASLVTNLRAISPKPISANTSSSGSSAVTTYSSIAFTAARPSTVSSVTDGSDPLDIIFARKIDRLFFFG